MYLLVRFGFRWFLPRCDTSLGLAPLDRALPVAQGGDIILADLEEAERDKVPQLLRVPMSSFVAVFTSEKRRTTDSWTTV